MFRFEDACFVFDFFVLVKLLVMAWPFHVFLGPWFQTFVIFTPILGEDEPILTSIFFKWVGSTNRYQKLQFLKGITFSKPSFWVSSR